METKPSPVALALLSVLKSDLYVRKAGRNREQNYNYASEADFLEAVRPLLAAAGVAVVPSYAVLDTHDGQTKAGTPNTRVTLAGTFTFIHADSGDRIAVTTIGQGVDTQDKAAYKAMTGALKYALRQTFLIETGDDPEKDTDDPPARQPSAQPPANRPAPESAARPSAPAAPPASGGSPATLTVAYVDTATGEKNGKPWMRYTAKFSDGTKASTFSASHGDILAEAKKTGDPVICSFEKKGNFTNLTSVAFVDTVSGNDDNVPF